MEMVEIRALEGAVVGAYPCPTGQTPDHVETVPEMTPEGHLIRKQRGHIKFTVRPAYRRSASPTEVKLGEQGNGPAIEVDPVTGEPMVVVVPEQTAVVPRDCADGLVARGLVEIVRTVGPVPHLMPGETLTVPGKGTVGLKRKA